MKGKRLLSVLLAGMMTASLAACSGGGSSSAASTSTPSEPAAAGTESTASTESTAGGGEKIDIRITTRWGGEAPSEEYWRNKIKEFSEGDNGVNIIDESIANEASYLDKLRTQIATGDQPEIFIEYGGARLKDYVEGGILVDMQPYLDEDPEWAGAFLNLFDKWQFPEYEGQTYGIPNQFYTILLYYNSKILADNNVEVPKTMEELEAACDTLVKNGAQAFKLGEKDVWRAGHFFNQLVVRKYGVEMVSKLGDRSVAYDSPEMVELYGIIKKFNDNGWFGPNAVGVDVNAETTAFKNGENAFEMNGSWLLGELPGTPAYDDIDVAPFPYLDEKYATTFQGGSAEGYSISKRDDDVVAASVKVVKFLTSADYYAGMEAYCKGGVYPVKFESQAGVEIDPLTVKAKDVINTGTDFRDDVQTYDQASHMLDTVRNALQGLFIGNTPEQCGAEIIEKDKANS